MANNRYLWTIAVLVVIGWAAVALLQPGIRVPLLDALAGGFMFGTMFGHAGLAATWCALGPLPLAQRLPLSALWLTVVSMALGLNLARESASNGLVALAMFGGILLLEWVLVQIPLWVLTTRRGLRIVHASATMAEGRQSEQQFGIRHVLILTTLVAIVLSFGRFALGGLKQEGTPPPASIVVVFSFLAIFNAIYTLTVAGASFLETWRYVGAGLAIVAVGLMSLLEVPLLDLAARQASSRHEYVMFTSFNLVQATWIAVVLLLLRAGGYRLVSMPGRK
jgi:hypothetical protein